ncbi:MAG TPA: hypothetical protein VLI90_05960, partial [Tepidisphaeraceae bacterium]|nr:hypothetical protein [Tepidisphaeraceae bacterium]
MKSRLLATDTLDVSGKILKNALSAIARHRGDFRPARSWPALLLIMLAAVNTAEGPTLFGPPSIAFASAPASPTTQPTGIATADGPLKLIDLTFPSDPPINDPQLTQIDPPKPEQIWRAVRSHLAPDPAIDSDPLSLIPATTPS